MEKEAIQGGSQKLLLTTKESIISSSIFFWTTLYDVHSEMRNAQILLK